MYRFNIIGEIVMQLRRPLLLRQSNVRTQQAFRPAVIRSNKMCSEKV